MCGESRTHGSEREIRISLHNNGILGFYSTLRQYRMRPGQEENWVNYMEEVIIPFQISKGMVILGGFVGEEEKDLYVWIRRFESEAQRETVV